MLPRQRIESALSGQAVDRPPFSLWSHFSTEVDHHPQALAQATYAFATKHRLDFIKTMNNGMYSAEAYGCSIDFSDVSKGGVAKVIDTPIKKIEDWRKVEEIGLAEGALKREVDSVRCLLETVTNGSTEYRDLPIIFTVFSPLTTAHKISQGKVFDHIDGGGEKIVGEALSRIAETTARLCAEVIALGVDGVFFATQLCQRGLASEDVYRKYGLPYDLQALAGAGGGWFNALHLHGEDVMFDFVNDYPVHCVNWHIWESPPALPVALATTQKCIMGGIKRASVSNGVIAEIAEQVSDVMAATKGKRIILTPGCGLRQPVDENAITFTRGLVDGFAAI
jgi:uroporphyrinogen decarboxylase